jgi:hypothetical protein
VLSNLVGRCRGECNLCGACFTCCASLHTALSSRGHAGSAVCMPMHGTDPTRDPRARQELDALPDPCPLPRAAGADGAPRRRTLNERERLLWAPMGEVGGLLWDRDAVYIDIPDWKVRGHPQMW